jgi:hypothetical protein
MAARHSVTHSGGVASSGVAVLVAGGGVRVGLDLPAAVGLADRFEVLTVPVLVVVGAGEHQVV